MSPHMLRRGGKDDMKAEKLATTGFMRGLKKRHDWI
ncbi:hypothetical protein LLT3_16120 [Lactococcus cremoris subsp. cremoris TIFN3]|uniref:Uncharacterized protein n=1 Tax=Lactococcus cremoris subsp. cremoris TIFN3 TaxID=1234873 RepID=T0WIB0_LACLC|nr:hypothetical protein LLT3_16120 [Lactococcus cremoris subsp. cremoris TIFN3]